VPYGPVFTVSLTISFSTTERILNYSVNAGNAAFISSTSQKSVIAGIRRLQLNLGRGLAVKLVILYEVLSDKVKFH
jgi:hypothetical protein